MHNKQRSPPPFNFSLDISQDLCYYVLMENKVEELSMLPILVPSKLGGENPPEVHRITREEKEAADTFVKLGSYELASNELGIDAGTVLERTRTPATQLYIKQRALLAASAAGLTVDKILATINDCIDGVKDLTPSQARALDLGAKILKLVQPSSHLHLTQNNTTNYWNGKSDEEMDQEIEERLRYMKVVRDTDNLEISRDATA